MRLWQSLSIRLRPIRCWLPLVSFVAIMSILLYSSAALVIYLYGQADHAAPADVIVVLGAGVYRNGRPSAGHLRRTLHAAALYREGLAPFILCTGGYDSPQHIKSEGAVCTEILKQAGIPASAILVEEHSQNTEENAIETRRVMESHRLKTALIVSDNFHLARAKLLFMLQGIHTIASPAQVTAGPLSLGWAVYGSYREVAAFAWNGLRMLLSPREVEVN